MSALTGDNQMKTIAIATLIAAFAAPAIADDCMPQDEAFANLANNGFAPTFVDKSGEFLFIMSENGKGAWIIIAVIGDKVCPVIGGTNGEHLKKKPNA